MESEENLSEEQIEETGESEEEIKEELEEKVEERKLEEEIVEERIYTVPLSRAWLSPRRKRAPRAIRILRSFIERHMKPESIIITNEVNERIWSRGIEKPPRKIRVRAVKDRDGRVTIHLVEGD